MVQFTVEETNLLSIYHEGGKAQLMENMTAALPDMDADMRELARRNCINGKCLLLDDGDECVCPQLISYSLLCKWFCVAVLPADKLLYAELMNTEDKKRCTECGAFFASSSNSVKYCPECRKWITRRQAAERMKKMRSLLRDRGAKALV